MIMPIPPEKLKKKLFSPSYYKISICPQFFNIDFAYFFISFW